MGYNKALVVIAITVVLFLSLTSLASAATNTDYVEYLYTAVLARSGSAGEVAAWSTAIDIGATNRLDVAHAFIMSRESHTRYVNNWYTVYFSRSPGAAELAGWVNAMDAGLLQDQFRARCESSDEMFNRYGWSNQTFVQWLYGVLLNRYPINPTEITPWVDAINSGVLSRYDVATAIYNSHEHHGFATQLRYAWHLGRSPALAEREAWANAMDAGMTEEMVQAAVIASYELFVVL